MGLSAQLNLSQLGTVKLGVHALQGILVFITAIIAIAMDSQSGKAGGRGIWFNILVRFNLPLLHGRVLTIHSPNSATHRYLP
jgi:hypothetical protein